MIRIHLLAGAVLCAGCVTTSSRDQAVADLNRQHQEQLDKTKADDAAQLADAQKKLAETEAARKDLEAKLAAAQKRTDELGKLLQGTAADKDKLDKLLQATNTQLEELGRQKAAADARAATYKSLTDRLRSMIDAGRLSVRIRKGRMLISLPNDVPVPDRGTHRRQADPQRAVPVELGAVDGARGGGDAVPHQQGHEARLAGSRRVRRVRSGGAQRHRRSPRAEPAHRDPAPAEPERAAVDAGPGEAVGSPAQAGRREPDSLHEAANRDRAAAGGPAT